jgi:putative PIN family toxin of toxin-antitoxin system
VIRAVLDTNVLASGFASDRGTPGQLLLAWTYGGFELIVSTHILTELTRTFAAPYFRERLSSQQIAANLALLRDEATSAPIITQVHGIATHPEDDLVLATAVSGQAEYLVTGDRQLLHLGTYQGVAILSPRAFWEILQAQQAS